jgi:hypothetical protein
MVPFLNAFLNLYYTSLFNNSQRFIVDLFIKHSRIAALLFLSNTLYEKSYTKEVNTVAKLKEKLLRSIGTLNGQGQGRAGVSSQDASSSLADIVDNMAATAYDIRQQFFTDERISQILQLLLNDCLMFSSVGTYI